MGVSPVFLCFTSKKVELVNTSSGVHATLVRRAPGSALDA
jgi:hypothetical protein